MQVASENLVQELSKARVALDHNLSKGEALESAVKALLRGHLPASIGVTSGQVIDANGRRTGQLDVILYDLSRTPVLFIDKDGHSQLVPAEGVIAAIEVKTQLGAAEARAAAAAARQLKQLRRDCYYNSEPSPIVRTVRAYGQEWPVLPIMYFVFAFEGAQLDTLVQAAADAHEGTATYERIDAMCVLERGVVANAAGIGSRIDALPFPGSYELGIPTAHALLFFYVLLTRYVLQAEIPPISIQSYLPAHFEFSTSGAMYSFPSQAGIL